MKVVIMAGGEGTRLRPLTSNQPKPMVPVVGKPCMEHIIELLRRHGFEGAIITLAFLPQAIESYFGNGESLGFPIEYSLEETPLGTAGSVRLASRRFDEPILVISGDALTDFDLTSLVEYHEQRGAAVTIALKAVENPLDFGIVVTDEDGRIERFLEKPSWGQVFSDTINTGIYVLDPGVLQHVPDDRPFDFSKELFPLLLEMGMPMYGFVCEGYWQDIGNLDQYRQANFDALDELVELAIPGIRLRGNVWIGDGVEIDDLDGVEGPAFIGNYSSISPDATVGAYSVLGAQTVVMPNLRIFPRKEVESGTVVHESLIWEASGVTHLFGRDGVSGVVNVELTPEVAVRLAAAFGTALQRGARVVASREANAACRMIKRAMVSGLTSTGINIADLRVLPAPLSRHLLRTLGHDAGFHVGMSPSDPETIEIRFFEPPGIQLTAPLQQEIDKHFTRYELRRVAPAQIGKISYPVRVRETYAQDLLATVDARAIGERGFRVVVDYGQSAASFVMPLVLGPLGVETVSAHEFAEFDGGGPTLREAMGQAKRLVEAVGADLGAVFDRPGERLFLVAEDGQEIPVEQTVLLFLELLGRRGAKGSVVFPLTVTSHVDAIADRYGLEVVRTTASLADLSETASRPGVVFAAAIGGAYAFPTFQPGFDAMAALCRLLELLAPLDAPLSSLVAELPVSTVVHRHIPCPWSLKGTVMRVLTEQLKDRELDLRDGIKVVDGHGWALVRPDPVEPLLHVYAEGETRDASRELERALHELVDEVLQQEDSRTPSEIST